MNSPLTATEWLKAAMLLFCVICIFAWIAYEIGRAVNLWFNMRSWRRMSLPPPDKQTERQAFSHRVGDVRGYRK